MRVFDPQGTLRPMGVVVGEASGGRPGRDESVVAMDVLRFPLQTRTVHGTRGMLKRRVAVLLAAGMAVAATASAAQATPRPTGAGDGVVPLCRITAPSASVHARQTTSSPQIAVAHRGETCTRLDLDVNKTGCWNKVRLRSGQVGWIRHEQMEAARDNLPICTD
jgi:hypothetical protein